MSDAVRGALGGHLSLLLQLSRPEDAQQRGPEEESYLDQGAVLGRKYYRLIIPMFVVNSLFRVYMPCFHYVDYSLLVLGK